jgi:FxLD family lantipeptide
MQAINTNTAVIDDAFELDLHIVIDNEPGVAAPCGTDDGCAPTCASSCTSNA